MQVLGIDYRWEGPFGSVSDAGPMGAFIFVYGIFRTGIKRVIFLGGGLFILIFAFSFSSIFATLVAVGFIVSRHLSESFPTRKTFILVGIFSGVFVVISAYIWFFNRNLNGRTQIWVQYISELPNHVFFGAGSQFMSTRTDLLSHDHGHNLYVDTLLRYGTIGFVLFALVLLSLGYMSWISLKVGSNLPMVILIVFALCVVGESLVLWRYNGVLITWLIIAALIANTDIHKARSSK
jgi:O-antigen ligase